jgi:succinyl-diaminopimelate desuccinylase
MKISEQTDEELKTELVNLLKKLVEYKSVNNPQKNLKSPKECPAFIVKYLDERGIKAHLHEDDGYYSVYGKIGEGKHHLALMAHFDVVPVGDSWETEPFRFTMNEDNSMAFGRGVTDDKSNITALMTILPEIKSLPLGDRLTVTFDFSGDEEIGGRHGAGTYLDKFERLPDGVLNADGSGMVIISRRRNGMGAKVIIPKKPAKISGCKSSKTFTTEQFGRHTAYQNPLGDVHCMIRASVAADHNNWYVSRCEGKFVKGNVVPDACTLTIIDPEAEKGEQQEFSYDENLTKLIHSLRFIVRTQFPTKFSTYGITIGPNVFEETKDSWVLTLDIRAMTQDYSAVEKALKEMFNELVGKENYQLTFKEGQGMVNTDKNELLIQSALTAAEKLGLSKEIVEMGGASDARYFSKHGIPTFDYGPLGGNVHASNEYLQVDSLVKTTRFYLEVVKTMLQKIQ